MELSDESLCERVAGRDEAAFNLLVERYQQRAYRLAWSILRDAEEARDLSQEAFIRLYQAAGSFGGRARFSTWFYRILVNLCLDHRRKHRWWRRTVGPAHSEEGAEGSALERLPAAAEDPLEELGRGRDMSRLWTAVDGLSPQQRAALLLQVQEELPTAEIALVLKCSEATVRVHLHRALTALRKTMGGT
ncbi:MAG: sigma-70 family RNA polymerase sigma factor [Candidatus Rokubacteria bacterium]|nr:sigma-70 family RNA polymerase sigma factor [Candidatus Rokubacteria bacterium]